MNTFLYGKNPSNAILKTIFDDVEQKNSFV